jgi:hypothetical protein
MGLRLRPQESCQASAAHVLQNQIGQSIVFADLEDLNDVGMVELRGSLSFSAEPFSFAGAGVLTRKDHFQGDDPVQVRLPGLVNDSHAAAAQLLDDVVGADPAQPRT